MEKRTQSIEGMCCDCLNEREPFCGDFTENIDCPYRKTDGSCWTALEDGEDHDG